MAIAASPSPASSASCPDYLTPHCLSNLCNKPSRVWIDVLLLCGITLSIVLRFASRRRYISSVWFRYPLWAVYLSISSIVPYTLGMMSQQPPKLQSCLYPAWGYVIVMVAYGLSGSISVFSLDENENTTKLDLELAMLSIYVVLLPQSLDSSYPPVWITVCMLSIAIVNFHAKSSARTCASLSSRGGAYRLRAQISDYMETEHGLTDRAMVNPSSMVGYKYMVDPTRGIDITIERIWSCERTVVNTGNHQEDEKRKDLCLSFAFFWLLLRRYGGYPLHEASQEKTWLLVGETLLPGDEGDHERAFRVIEVELHFLYDFFYTKYCAMFLHWRKRSFLYYLYYIQYVVGTTIAVFQLYNRPEEDVVEVQIYGLNMDSAVSWVMFVTVHVLSIWSIVTDATSIWSRVQLIIRSSVREENVKVFEKMQEIILRPNWRMRHPWARELGQYSFLDSYAYVPWYWKARKPLFWLMNLPRDGQREDKRIELSDQVKRAIAKSIKKNGRRLSNGVVALARYGLYMEYQYETAAEHILVWHIATALAGKDARPLDNELEDYNVAVSLSKYCAYLVAFAPELLPDLQHTADTVFDRMISKAKEILAGCDERYILNKMKNIPADTRDQGECSLKKAAWWTDVLLNINNIEGQMWKMLAEFWAELLVYLAPSENVKAHAEHLATGGEFITHIWALLTHAGIITRDTLRTVAPEDQENQPPPPPPPPPSKSNTHRRSRSL